MSETPQETLEKYALDKYCRPEIREAIRAVLADLGGRVLLSDFEAQAWRADKAEAERDALLAEVERLRMEFRRIEEVVASMVAGERCYAQVLKVLHEAPRVLPAPKEGA